MAQNDNGSTDDGTETIVVDGFEVPLTEAEAIVDEIDDPDDPSTYNGYAHGGVTDGDSYAFVSDSDTDQFGFLHNMNNSKGVYTSLWRVTNAVEEASTDAYEEWLERLQDDAPRGFDVYGTRGEGASDHDAVVCANRHNAGDKIAALFENHDVSYVAGTLSQEYENPPNEERVNRAVYIFIQAPDDV